MADSSLVLFDPQPERRFSARDVVAIGFRHRLLLMATFLVALFGVGAWGLWNRDYESKMALLVNRERVDPLISPEQNPAARYQAGIVTEEELNSETQLLTSDDLLRKVVLAAGLSQSTAPGLWPRLRRTSDEKRVAGAVQRLSSALRVAVPKKSNIIVVRYRSREPSQASQVLRTLANLYFERHAQVHRAPGQYEFFDQQAERYRAELASADARLAEFPEREGVVAGEMERDLMLQKTSELNVALQTTTAATIEAKKRIAALQAQIPHTPERMTTVVRRADNAPLMEKLRGTLLDLELQRTELLEKYQPTHRKVLELEQKIAETRSAIEGALKTPMTEQTTDRDPTYEWMRGELAKARTDLQSLEARAGSIRQSIAENERRAQALNKRSIEQQGLIRTAKALEENYQLYLRKREEARITDALDRSRILNIALAEEPTTPVMPAQSLVLILMKAFLAACLVGMGAVLVAEHLDPTFRTPAEVQHYLGVPVLAALPERVE